MSHGGARKGAGKPKGTTAKIDAEIREQALATGISPLDYMLDLLRNTELAWQDRFEAAKAAAPYVHAKLSSTENSTKLDLSGGLTWLPVQ